MNSKWYRGRLFPLDWISLSYPVNAIIDSRDHTCQLFRPRDASGARLRVSIPVFSCDEEPFQGRITTLFSRHSPLYATTSIPEKVIELAQSAPKHDPNIPERQYQYADKGPDPGITRANTSDLFSFGRTTADSTQLS